MLGLQRDWAILTGRWVEVRRYDKVIRRGRVDAVMPDGSILWLSSDATHGRQMLERIDGYQVWSGQPH